MSMETHPVHFNEEEFRAMVRIFGEISCMSAPINVRKARLMDVVSEMINADLWMWTVTRFSSDGDYLTLNPLHRGLSVQQVAYLYEKSYWDCDVVPEVDGIVKLLKRGQPFSRTREQLVPDDTLEDNESFWLYRKKLDMGESLYSFFPITQDFWSCLGLHRRFGRDAFNNRERRLAHAVISEVDWLHRAETPSLNFDRISGLPRRLRKVLSLLLEGQCRKVIAGNLRLSEYTVRDYMSEIYHHFGVCSQVELLRSLASTVEEGKGG